MPRPTVPQLRGNCHRVPDLNAPPQTPRTLPIPPLLAPPSRSPEPPPLPFPPPQEEVQRCLHLTLEVLHDRVLTRTRTRTLTLILTLTLTLTLR